MRVFMLTSKALAISLLMMGPNVSVDVSVFSMAHIDYTASSISFGVRWQPLLLPQPPCLCSNDPSMARLCTLSAHMYIRKRKNGFVLEAS